MDKGESGGDNIREGAITCESHIALPELCASFIIESSSSQKGVILMIIPVHYIRKFC